MVIRREFDCRGFSEEGSQLEFYSTMLGKEIRTLEVQSQLHHGVEIDFKLPYDLLQGSYKSWLKISIAPQENLLQGCRTEQQGGECTLKRLSCPTKIYSNTTYTSNM